MDMCYNGALVMPSSYAVMDEEEMTYTDGGTFLSKSKCRDIICGLGMNPSTFVAVALTVALATKLVNKITRYCGALASVVSWCLRYAGACVLNLARAVGGGAVCKGVDISWSWNPFDFGLNSNIHH